MNVVDSSCWLEYFADGPNADAFRKPIEDIDRLIVPAVVLLEVFKRILQQRGEDAALLAAAHMAQGRIVDLDSTIALHAAHLGHELGLPLADSIIFATARALGAVLWTQDRHFQSLENVRYYPRQ